MADTSVEKAEVFPGFRGGPESDDERRTQSGEAEISELP